MTNEQITKITPKELATILDQNIGLRQNTLIVGPPGIGKSEICYQSAIRNNADFMIINAICEDPTDAKGYPFAIEVNGQHYADHLVFGHLRKMMEANKLLVVCLEDFGQSTKAVQAAYMQIILAREINGFKLSDQVVFIANTNRREDKAGVGGILEPLKSRFLGGIYHLETAVNDWSEWMIENKKHYLVTAFIRWATSNQESALFDFRPTLDLINTPNPRLVTAVADQLDDIFTLPKNLQHAKIAGICGESWACKFLAFTSMYKSLHDIAVLFADPLNATIPVEPSVVYAVCGAIAHRVTDNTFSRAIEYLERLPEEFAVMTVFDAVRAKPELRFTKEFIEFDVKHQNCLK